MFFGKRMTKRISSFEKEMMQTYYDEVENMYTQMRGWRHDYRHHIQTLKAYLANGEYAAAEQYLDLLDADLTNVETVIKTGNRMADAILNSKLSAALQKDIRVKAEANIPVTLSIAAVDLCIILGNLLDNAIAACLELPPDARLIRVYMTMKGNYFYFVLTNTAGGEKKHSFRSKKGDGHGFGLARVDEIVKKYGGYLTRASEDEAFSTEILLPL